MTKTTNPRCYTIVVGPFELRHWGDDRTAKRIAKRWTSLCFARAVMRLHTWSIAYAIANENPLVEVYRHAYSPARGVAGMSVCKVSSWSVFYNKEQ